MKFDYIIGNPPYQDDVENKGDRPNPVYDKFMDASYKIADCVELITPARFLFNAGQTSKAWNQKMLDDEHLKVLQYESDASKIFPTTEIKGGVAVTLHDVKKPYGAIKVFTSRPELNEIVKKVTTKHTGNYLDSIISSRGCYRTTDKFFEDYPDASSRLGKGTGNMIASNFFERIPEAYVMEIPDDGEEYISMLARLDGKRTICYIKKKYVRDNEFIGGYNVACPKSNGNGVFGEALTSTEILEPNQGATDTFINMGSFETVFEAESLSKYFKTKFFRALLGVKKVTQDNPKAVWNMIPLLDFTRNNTNIEWTGTIEEIDRQLYKMFGLSESEITFVEENVKEMA